MISRDILKNWNILIVDDELDAREVAARILAYYGANVFKASDGEEALCMIKSTPMQLVISDLSMPVMDGWELIRQIRNSRDTAALPVFALTAQSYLEGGELARQAGFDNFMTKPLTASTFMSNLLSMLEVLPQLNGLLSSYDVGFLGQNQAK